MTIALGVSFHFHNKENRAPMRAHKQTGEQQNQYAYGEFKTVNWTINEIVRHIIKGNAISVGAFNGEWRAQKYFKSSQLMGVDFDGGPAVDVLLENEFIRDHAFLVYPTASSTAEKPRSRALFALDEPITDMDLWRKYVKRLMHHFGHEVDEACKDAARIFYGSDCKLPDQPRRNLDDEGVDVRLPLLVLSAMKPHPDELPREQKATPPGRKFEGDHAAYVQKALETELDAVRACVKDRNITLNQAAFALGQFVAAPWAKLSRIDAHAALLTAAPIAADFTRIEVERTITSGLDAGMRQPRLEPVGSTPYYRTVHSTNGVNALQEITTENFRLEDFVTSRKTELNNALLRLKPDSIPERQPVFIPFTALHRFGGYARLIMPGKLVGLIGPTGIGKSSMLDTWIDAFNRNGENVLGWTPEWTPQEIADRTIQRYGGASAQDTYDFYAYKALESKGADPASLGLKALTSEQITASAQAAVDVGVWTGDFKQIYNPELDFDQMMMVIRESVRAYREQGTEIRIFILDYAQMIKLNARDTRRRTLNDGIAEIKAMCIALGLVGIIASQVNKSDQREGKIDITAGHWLRLDAFNLAIALDQTSEGHGKVEVLKNSMGRKGNVIVPMDLEHLLWVDRVISEGSTLNPNVSLDEKVFEL